MRGDSGALFNARLCTLAGDTGYGMIECGAIGWRDGVLAHIGETDGLPADLRDLAADANGALVTPGLIDCHTHLVFGGDRAGEFEQRLAGASYAEIARAGGGIAATVRATRAADEHSLLEASLPRARALRDEGVTTLEIKSGYGLAQESEARMLRVARRIGQTLGVSVATTALCAHAVPPEFAGDADGYVRHVCEVILPALAAEGLVDAVDGFCEGIGFSPAQIRQVFVRARELGLAVKLHADQLSDLGGAGLAAEFAGLSADHVEYASEEGIRAMARARTVAVLLPGAFYCLRETRLPPVAAFRRLGVGMAVATDLNPGTSPLTSLRLAMNMACTLFGLSVEEVVRGTTVESARALGMSDRGRLIPGMRADLVVWPVSEPAALPYWLGPLPPRQVLVAGRRVAGSAASP